MIVRTYVCNKCGRREDVYGAGIIEIKCCGYSMVRDYSSINLNDSHGTKRDIASRAANRNQGVSGC